MADLQEEKDIIAALSKKIDYEAKFTRVIVVVCCLATIANTFYSLTAIVGVLPDMVIAKFSGNIDNIQREWHSLDKQAKLREHNNE